MSLFKTVTMSIKGVIGSYVNGKWRRTETTGTTFKGTFQPLSGKDADFLPEGRRAGASFRVYSDLNFDTVTTTENPDLIVVNNVKYEIVAKLTWQNTLINHYKYIVQEVTEK